MIGPTLRSYMSTTTSSDCTSCNLMSSKDLYFKCQPSFFSHLYWFKGPPCFRLIVLVLWRILFSLTCCSHQEQAAVLHRYVPRNPLYLPSAKQQIRYKQQGSFGSLWNLKSWQMDIVSVLHKVCKNLCFSAEFVQHVVCSWLTCCHGWCFWVVIVFLLYYAAAMDFFGV